MARYIKAWKASSSGKTNDIGNDNANNNSGHNSTIIGGKGKVFNTMKVMGDVKVYYTGSSPIPEVTFSGNPDAGAPSSKPPKTPSQDSAPDGPPSSTDEHAPSASQSTESNNGESSQGFKLPMDAQWVHDALTHKPPGARAPASFTSGRSSIFGARVTYLKRLLRSDMKHHLPQSTAEHIVSYMLTGLLSSNESSIPLWEPSPSLHSHPQTWRRNVYIGDVGVFNSQGGFDTFFNIFQPLEENHARDLDPPSNFYPFTLLGQGKIHTHHYPTDNPRSRGFVTDNNKNHLLRTFYLPDAPLAVSATHCSAIYIPHGYDRLMLHEREVSAIDSYVQEHQATWKDHFGSNIIDNRRNTLVLITGCDRVKSWSSAAATVNPSLSLKKRTGTAVLKDIQRSGRDRKVWAVVGDIETMDGPSSPHIEDEEAYFRNFGATIDAKTRHEIEACHCIAVQAYYLDKKWTLSSLKSNQSTVKGSVHAPHPVVAPKPPMQETRLSISTLPSIEE